MPYTGEELLRVLAIEKCKSTYSNHSAEFIDELVVLNLPEKLRIKLGITRGSKHDVKFIGWGTHSHPHAKFLREAFESIEKAVFYEAYPQTGGGLLCAKEGSITANIAIDGVAYECNMYVQPREGCGEDIESLKLDGVQLMEPAGTRWAYGYEAAILGLLENIIHTVYDALSLEVAKQPEEYLLDGLEYPLEYPWDN